MDKLTITVVDDDKRVVETLTALLGDKYDVTGFFDGRKALEFILSERPQIVLIDVRLDDYNGIEIMKEVKEEAPEVNFIVMSAYTTTTLAIEAIQAGAVDYIHKPFENEDILEGIRKARKYSNLTTDDGFKKVIHSSIYSKHREQLVGRNPKMLDIYKTVGHVARTKSNVLITGESGTGKELVARIIATMSGCPEEKFMTVNCSAIPETLFESELFGYEKGAFTGADRQKIGKVEACNRGILFLDEIDTLPLLMQSKILRLIQQKEYQRVGGIKTLKADVRIVAATKADIEQQVAQETFKEDLFYRLSVIRIDVPPLRERRDDITELFNYFLTETNRKHGKKIRNVSSGLLDRLREYSWPGNVRELENAVERAVILAGDGILTEENFDFLKKKKGDLKMSLPGTDDLDEFFSTAVRMLPPDRLRSMNGDLYTDLMGLFEKNLFGYILERVKGNQVKAAKMLGISRNTLRDRIKRFDISAEKNAAENV